MNQSGKENCTKILSRDLIRILKWLSKKSCFLNIFLRILVHTHTFLVAWKQKMVKRIFGNFDKETVTMSGVALNSPPGKRVFLNRPK